MSTPTDSSSAAADRDPVQEAREYLEQALAALNRLREVLPASSMPASRTGGGEPS